VAERTPWGSDWEDYLVLFGDRLDDYRSQLLKTWEMQALAFDRLRSALDDTLADWYAAFLRQLGDGRRTIAKSPSAENLDRVMPWLLRDVDVVMVVRDPRAVLQSARMTFTDSFERRLQAYVRSGQAILGSQSLGGVVVRYEDLLDNRRHELGRVLDAVGLPRSGYDFDAADHLPIRGSSTAASPDTRWHGTPWHAGFDGHRRDAQLPARLRRRVEWVARREMEAFGYDGREAVTATQALEMRTRDAAYRAARKSSRTLAALARTEDYVYSAKLT
jgi:hypothetical protein